MADSSTAAVVFEADLALELAEHAAAVYGSASHFFRWSVARNCYGAHIIERGSTQVGITYSADRIVIAARGSSQMGDWGENLLAWRWMWRDLFPCGGVHLGMSIQVRRVVRELRATLATLRARYPEAAVYVTGHSLGGGLAHFLVRLAELGGVRVTAAYTFEAPRTGGPAWARWYDAAYGSRTFRVVAIRRGRADIVTRVPPASFGWRHVGRPCMLRDGVLYESEDVWQASRDEHPVKPLAWWRVISGLATAVAAHHCGALVEDLRRLREARERGGLHG